MDLIKAVAETAQFKILFGLVFLDVVLAVAAALRTGSFNWAELAGWFRGMVAPYLIYYVGLVIAISFSFPVTICLLHHTKAGH